MKYISQLVITSLLYSNLQSKENTVLCQEKLYLHCTANNDYPGNYTIWLLILIIQWPLLSISRMQSARESGAEWPSRNICVVEILCSRARSWQNSVSTRTNGLNGDKEKTEGYLIKVEDTYQPAHFWLRLIM